MHCLCHTPLRAAGLSMRPSDVSRDVEVQYSPTIMTQDYQHEQDPEGRRWDREEIQGDQLLGMVPKKRSPSLGRRPPMLDHVLGYGGF